MHRMFYATLLATFLLTGCVVAPSDRDAGWVVAPALPVVVELGLEPYYFHNGFYYYYHNQRWSYSPERTGPWRELPRDRYPREIRYKDHDGRDWGHHDGEDRDRDRDYRRD